MESKRIYKEVVLNFEMVSAKKYSKVSGLAYQIVLQQCENGTLDAYKTDGGQWRVKVHKGDMVSKVEFEKLQAENIKLKTSLEAIKSLVAIN